MIESEAYSAKAARAGKDIGKKGKNFEKIAKKAAERYGSEERGKKVAGAILKKLRMKEEAEQLGEKAPPGKKFERMVKHIKKGYESGGLTKQEKGIAYATAWKSYNKEEVELAADSHFQTEQKQRVAEGYNKNVVKSVKVGNFRHDLVNTGFGWQVRIYIGDELYDAGLSKNSVQKGLAALDDAVAYTKKQLNIKEQGVAEEVEQIDELKTGTLLRYATKATKSLTGGDRSKENKRIKGIQLAKHKIQQKPKMKKEVESVSELSNELLGRYKKAAASQASAADKAGDFEKGNKRFKGVVKATNKQFANDARKFAKEEVELDEAIPKSTSIALVHTASKKIVAKGDKKQMMKKMKELNSKEKDSHHLGATYRGKVGDTFGEEVEQVAEKFSDAQIAALRTAYSKISGIDPESHSYQKLLTMLDDMDKATLRKVADGNIKFVSGLARNRLQRMDEDTNMSIKFTEFRSRLNEASYMGKGNHKPGWMLRADPELARKFKEIEDRKKRMNSMMKKYGGKTSDEIAKMKKEEVESVAEGSLSGLEVYMDPKDGKVKKYPAKSTKPTTGLDVYMDPKDGKVKKYPAKQGVKEEASPMIKPPSNRFDNKKDAFAHAKTYGGKVYRHEYINPRSGMKSTTFSVKEEVELDEVSMGTLKSYRKKSSMTEGSVDPKYPHGELKHRIVYRRSGEKVEGSKSFSSKADAQKYVANNPEYSVQTYRVKQGVKDKTYMEEVEQVDEVIGNTTGYSDSGPRNKADERKFHQMRNVVTKGPRKGKITKFAQNRLKDRLMSKTHMDEEIEQVDELKQSTLGSYIKKASHDVATKSALTRHFATKSGDERAKQNYTQARKDDETSNKLFNKSWKRRQGIAKAVDRLTKKEVEIS